MPLIFRLIKGGPLTFQEGDDNLRYLEGLAVSASVNFSNWTGSSSSQFAGTASYALNAGTTPTLQQVTTAGSSSVNNINLIDTLNNTLISLTKAQIGPPTDLQGRVVISSNFDGRTTAYTSTGVVYSGSNGISNLGFPNVGASRTFAVSVNGVSADASGSITIPTGSATNPGGSDTEIQFNSGSTFSGSAAFRFIYASQSLEQGFSVQAIGQHSHAEGYFTQATGPGAHAEGVNTQATNEGSHAEGTDTQALGPSSHAEGSQTIAYGNGSHAEGYQTQAVNQYSHAEGSSTVASGSYSHAEGVGTIAIGEASHTAGWNTVASGSYQSVIGQYNISSSAQSAFIIGNGSNDNNRSNLLFASGSQVQITGRLDVSGSGRFTNGLTVTGSTNISSSGTALTAVGNVNLNGWTDFTNGINTLNWGYNIGTNTYFANTLSGVGLKVGPGVEGNYRFILAANGDIQGIINGFGIGVFSPTYKMHVTGSGPSGSLNIDGRLLVSSSLVTVSGSLDVSGSGRFTNGLTVSASLTAPYINGGVRIGTSVTSSITNSGTLLVGDAPNNGAISFLNNTLYFNGINGYHFNINTGLNGGTDTTLFSVRNNGNVLINTTNDQGFKLDVSGSARITDVLTLPFQNPLPSGKPTGSIALSGSGATYVGMFVYDGTNWVTA